MSNGLAKIGGTGTGGAAGTAGATVSQKRVSNTQSQQKEKSKEPNVIQIPGEFFPHANFKNALWVRLSARQLEGIHTGGRGGTLQIGKKGATFKFLAPAQIIDTHTHNWEVYESIQTSILKKVIGFKTAADQFGQIADNIKTEYLNSRGSGWPSGQKLLNILQKVGDIEKPKYKIDAPLAYTDSQRRQYSLTFILADSRGGDIIESAVKLLQSYSAPESESELEIKFPYVFNVTTEPQGLINMQYAAITGIIATWMDPYINGKPSRCELSLNLTDMSPLFRKTITAGGIVNVNMPASQPTTDTKRRNSPREDPANTKRAEIPQTNNRTNFKYV